MEENRLPFRQLDNSPTTNLSYDREAQHWAKAFASQRGTMPVGGSSWGLIGALLTVLISAIIMLLSLVISIITWLFNLVAGSRKEPVEQAPPHKAFYEEEPDEDFKKTW